MGSGHGLIESKFEGSLGFEKGSGEPVANP